MSSMVRTLLVAIAAVAALLASPAAQGSTRTVAVAAASDLQTVLPSLVADFEKASGIKAVVTFGSSGGFFAQIQNGAPFDVFLSADVDYPRRLAMAGQADAATLYEYATGRLVVWARNDRGLNVKTGTALLSDPRVRRIAIANPDLAPYGRAAVAALKSRRLYDQVQPKLVFGDNISQTAQLVESGNADVGLLSHAVALGPAMKAAGAFSIVPAQDHPAIVQAAVLVSTTKNRDAALRFLAFLQGDQARRTLAAFGFGPPPPAR